MADYGNIIRREIDNSYVINNGMYHVPYEGEYRELWLDVDAYAKANPDKVTVEPIPPAPPEPTLEEVKEAKRNEIASARYKQANGGMEYNGHIADTDNDARVAITAQALACQLRNDVKVIWKMQDGYYMTFTPQEFIGFAGAVCDWVETLYDKERMLREQIDAAQTKEEVEKIKW